MEPAGLDWHTTDEAFETFAAAQLREAGTILFGRVTYEGMASYWPTPEAIAADPAVAEQMNGLPKLVFSRTLTRADWTNSRLAEGDAAAEVRRLKDQPGKDLIILASSNLAASLAEAGLIDEYRIMVNPVLLGRGTPLFARFGRDIRLTLRSARAFTNGNVLLTYTPAGTPA